MATTVQTNFFGPVSVLDTWDEIRSALNTGATVWKDGYVINGIDRFYEFDRRQVVWRYYAIDRYGVRCLLYEDGRVAYPRSNWHDSR